MVSVRNGRHIFKEIPTGYPEPGKTTVFDGSQTIDPETAPLNGGFLVKTLFLSIDPAMRVRMSAEDFNSYTPAFVMGKPLDNFGIGIVVRSDNSALKAGDHVYGIVPFQEYFVDTDHTKYRVLENKEKLPWSVYLGAAGGPGQTAYYAWKEYASPKKGETVFVTAAAGPVGSMLIQLAKLDGCKVIASAGSEEKVKLAGQFGADVAFNYKAIDTLEVLMKEGGIDIYWDNVGGPTLEAALEAAHIGARFIECGMVSGYGATEPYGIKNLVLIMRKTISLYGFLFFRVVPPKLATGELKYADDITKGLENVGEAILDVLQGKNKGKKIVLVAEE